MQSGINNLLFGVLLVASVGVGFLLENRIAGGGTNAPATSSPVSVAFGRMSEGAIAEKTVQIFNSGNFPLRVDHVVASCGCTTTTAPKEIPAHGSAPLTVFFNSRNRVGPIHQSVKLYFAGESGFLLVPTTGDVAQEVVFSTNSLDLGSDKNSKPIALTVTRLDNQPLTVSPVPPAPLRVRVEPLSASSARLWVSFATPPTAGVHEEELTLRLNHPGLPTTKIPVTWVTPSVYKTVPEQVNLGVVYSNRLGQQTVHISGPKPAKMRVRSVPEGVTALVRAASAPV